MSELSEIRDAVWELDLRYNISADLYFTFENGRDRYISLQELHEWCPIFKTASLKNINKVLNAEHRRVRLGMGSY